jgi:hypothetical protein
MDAVKGFWAQLLASTGNTELMVYGAVVLAILIVAVALAVGRRSNRLEDSLLHLREPHASVHWPEPRVTLQPGGSPDVLSGVNEALDSTGSREVERSGHRARLVNDPTTIRAGMATAPPAPGGQSTPVQDSMRGDQERIEMLQVALATLQSEQVTLRDLLQACNAGLQNIEQLVAAIPSLRKEHASIKKQLAELNTRFDAASEVLAGLLQSEDLPSGR